MAVTFGNMAKIGVQSAMAVGQAQANSLGLGQQSANALAITNLMGGKEEEQGMMGKLFSSATSDDHLRGKAFKDDLMDIANAAMVTGPGRGIGMSASSNMRGGLMGGPGGLINKVV